MLIACLVAESIQRRFFAFADRKGQVMGGGHPQPRRSQIFVQTPSLSDETKNRGPSFSFRRRGYGLGLVTLPSTVMNH